jgi:protein-disulfide isomerase
LEQQLIPAGTVRFAYRHYAFLGQESIWAAEASECAGEQGKFWPYYDRLNATEAPGGRNSGAFGKDVLKRHAVELGLNGEAFNGCLDGGRFASRVQAETSAGAARGVNSTPSVFVAGQKLAGVPPWEDLVRAILAAQRPG